MPIGPQRPCRHPGCSALVSLPATRCTAHDRAQRFVARVRDRWRGTAHERGYDGRWRVESRGFLARYPLCVGVLIATPEWSADLAQEFHALREAARERGEVLYLTHRPTGLTAAARSIAAFLAAHPIYRVETWDLQRPATVVDHIIPHKGDTALFWADWNWQPLTKRAHDRKTGSEDRNGADQPRPANVKSL